jgi:hypothetical protein
MRVTSAYSPSISARAAASACRAGRALAGEEEGLQWHWRNRIVGEIEEAEWLKWTRWNGSNGQGRAPHLSAELRIAWRDHALLARGLRLHAGLEPAALEPSPHSALLLHLSLRPPPPPSPY